MTGSQFTTILSAIESVRSDLSEKLDTIDARLRTVEVDQARACHCGKRQGTDHWCTMESGDSRVRCGRGCHPDRKPTSVGWEYT